MIKKFVFLAALAIPFTACAEQAPPTYNIQTDLMLTEAEYWGPWTPGVDQQVNVYMVTEADFVARCNDMGGFFRPEGGHLCVDIDY